MAMRAGPSTAPLPLVSAWEGPRRGAVSLAASLFCTALLGTALLGGTLASGGCASKRAAVLSILGVAAIGAGSAGVATKGATHLPIGPISILGIALGSVGLIFGALEGLNFSGSR